MIKLDGHFGEGFWKVTFGNIATVILTVLTVAYYAGQINAKVDALDNWKKGVDAKIDQINDTGTRAQAARNQIDDQKNVEQDRRISNMESIVQQVVPDVREIKTKLDLVTKYLEEGKARK